MTWGSFWQLAEKLRKTEKDTNGYVLFLPGVTALPFPPSPLRGVARSISVRGGGVCLLGSVGLVVVGQKFSQRYPMHGCVGVWVHNSSLSTATFISMLGSAP